MKTVFLRMLEASDKATAILAAVREHRPGDKQRYELNCKIFGEIPGSPFAYWASAAEVQVYRNFPSLKGIGAMALSTNQLSDDPRYVRLWWEPSSQGSTETWVPWAKGRTFARYYHDIQTVVRWGSGRATYTGFTGTRDRPLERPASADYFFEPGLTWPRRTTSLSVSVLPRGCIFGNKGPAVFWRDSPPDSLLALACVLNSKVFARLLAMQLARVELAQSFEVGLVQSTPVPLLRGEVLTELAGLAHRGWWLTRSLDSRMETSHALVLPALLQVEGKTLAIRAAEWFEHLQVVESELAATQADIDKRCFALYGIDDEDRQATTESRSASTDGYEASAEDSDEGADDDEGESGADTAALAAELVSWAVGVAFGRFDVRLATGDRPPPSEPEPFDPLPVCSPGMLTGDDGLPLSRPPAGYPLTFPDDGILVDDRGHSRDLTTAVRAVFEVVFGSAADAVWQEVAALLDPREHDLRRWLASGFFEHHLRRHSKSRRKAPILWQLGPPSGRYSVWCYAQRMTRDSLVAVQNDVVGQKLAHEERRLSSLVTQAGQSPSARERAEIAVQESVVNELRAFVNEIRSVATLWNPDLDDGVVLVMAPLWRLVPAHKVWQRELRAKWNELVAGKYDWAHLAMHLWPERIVPKCAADRSLAITHGLEDVFWVKGADEKWSTRKTPTHPIDGLIAERSAAAVKGALTSLIEASVLVAAGERRGRNRV
jgi:hypothetical protein